MVSLKSCVIFFFFLTKKKKGKYLKGVERKGNTEQMALRLKVKS